MNILLKNEYNNSVIKQYKNIFVLATRKHELMAEFILPKTDF